MDWQLTCRVCMESGDMVSLFDWDQNNQQLSDKYAYCCGVRVTEDDPLPKLMCLNCVDRLTVAYDFKVQCISSNDTLKECLEEYVKSTTGESTGNTQQIAEVETFTVKQENGMLLQYHVTKTANPAQLITMAPVPNKKGRPRKYPNQQMQHHISSYREKLKVGGRKTESSTTLPTQGSHEQKKEPADEKTSGHEDVNSEDNDLNSTEEVEMNSESEGQPEPRKRRKQQLTKKQKHEEDKDQLIKKKLLSEPELKPVPDQTLNPKSKNKNSAKKKYVYEKTHICETCNAAFSSNYALQVHIRRHFGIKPFVCKLCGFACVMKLELRRHMMKHTGLRPYKCSSCDRAFADYGSRQKHERVHTGQRPYECTVCNKTFSYSYVLTNHMMTHTGEKKYSCDQCNKKFIKAFELQNHNKRYHKELYEQQKLQAELKKAREKIDVLGIAAAFERSIDGGGTEEDGEKEEQVVCLDEDRECVEITIKDEIV